MKKRAGNNKLQEVVQKRCCTRFNSGKIIEKPEKRWSKRQESFRKDINLPRN